MTPFSSSRPLLWGLSAALCAALALALLSGRVNVSPLDILAVLTGRSDPTPASAVFLWIRLPRCLMAVLVGAGLAVSGAVYQALFRNPLVSPNILGVSAGCTFGAALGLMLPGDTIFTVHLLSFAFGLIAVAMSIGLARAIGIRPVIVLVLAGMVVLSFFNALLMVAKYFSDPFDELPGIIFWVMGSLSRVTWEHVAVMAPFSLAGTGMFAILGFRLNILSLGDVQAASLGLNPVLFRRLLILASSFLVAVAVAACGQIAWVGLVIPHMARTLVGPAHEKMIPVSALLGSLFLVTSDMAARSLTAAEIPVGIITALIGAPMFGLLLFRNRGAGWL